MYYGSGTVNAHGGLAGNQRTLLYISSKYDVTQKNPTPPIDVHLLEEQSFAKFHSNFALK